MHSADGAMIDYLDIQRAGGRAIVGADGGAALDVRILGHEAIMPTMNAPRTPYLSSVTGR